VSLRLTLVPCDQGNALLFGLFNLITGTWMLAQGTELRRAGKTLHSARE